MKSFKQFINESVTDLLQPKSDDEMINALKDLPNKEKIEKIIIYQLSYDLLPRNDKGICVYEGNLDYNRNELTSLPDNFTVNGNLDVSYNQLTFLPNNLIVKGNLSCRYNQLTSLPNNLTVGDNLDCDRNKLTSLPNNLTVGGNLDCRNNQLTSLPDNLTVGGNLNCYYNKVKLKLPTDAYVGGKFNN